MLRLGPAGIIVCIGSHFDRISDDQSMCMEGANLWLLCRLFFRTHNLKNSTALENNDT